MNTKENEEAVRLYRRFKTFVDYDSIATLTWKQINCVEVENRCKRDAVKLAIIACEEILRETSEKPFYKKVMIELEKFLKSK